MSEIDPRIADLDGIARELALVAGFDAAVKLMLHFGGQRLYIPDRMRPGSPFWKVLGGDVAKKLAAIASVGNNEGRDSDVYIPTGSRLERSRRRMAIAAFEGSKNEAAAAFGVSRRTVQRYRNRKRQADLFDDPEG